MEKKANLLMIYVQYSTFIKRDINILSSVYQVDTFCFDTKNKKRTPIAFIHQFFFLLFNFWKYKAFVIQSSGYVSFLPTLLGKVFKVPTYIIAIGTDCAKLPEINYGLHKSKLLGWFTRKSFYNASKILPVHKSLSKQTYTYTKIAFPNQGILAFCPKLKTPIVEVVNGYDIKKWTLRISRDKRKQNSFLTVTVVKDEVGFKRKGLDLIVEFAKRNLDYSFTIVGEITPEIAIPKNIEVIKPVKQEDLIEIYNTHEYYLQLSMFEGFPNALCEAMLCGCIPIASNVSGIPDIVGDFGFILKDKDVVKLKTLVLQAMDSNLSSEKVRNKIATMYPIEKRAEDLIFQIQNT